MQWSIFVGTVINYNRENFSDIMNVRVLYIINRINVEEESASSAHSTSLFWNMTDGEKDNALYYYYELTGLFRW